MGLLARRCCRRPIGRWALAVGIAVASLLPLASRATAALAPAPSLERLVAAADAVADVQVLARRCAWNPEHTLIFTTVTFEVLEQWAGVALPARVRLTFLGGALDDAVLTVPGLPVLEPGEERVMFLHRTAYGNLHVVGLDAGAIQVRRAGATALVAMPAGLALPAEMTASADGKWPLEALRAYVRRRAPR